MSAEYKLFAPIVEQTIPASLIPGSASETSSILQVPFQLNKTVSWVDLAQTEGVALILKTVSTGKILLDGFKGEFIKFNTSTKTPVARFEIPKELFLPEKGQFYKIQIAFVSPTGLIGHYSNVTIGKFTAKPEVYIQNLTNATNQAQYQYTGIFETEDISEKVYWYEFNIYDSVTGLLHDTSGQLVHDSSTDTERNSSFDQWTSYKTLVEERPYYINYKITTTNGLVIESQSYSIMSLETLDLISRNTEFIATLNADNGYVHIHILPKDIDADIKAITGNFILVRASSEDNFGSWHEIYRFTLVNNYPLMTIWKDFTVEQGYSYKYAIQAYNSQKIFSNRLECKYYLCEDDERDDDISRKNWNSSPGDASENVNLTWNYLQDPAGGPTKDGLFVDFEDAFLYDGKRQLRIRYNTKVSSFKSNTLETKVDTIGGKYPFIFKNGNTNYKEFPISGLITVLSDKEALFFEQSQRDETNRCYTLTPPYSKENSGWWYNLTGLSKYLLKVEQEKEVYDFEMALTAQNFKREREFKLEVLDWLTNGEPKLFRSPGEGNYIVRLMNSSLSPNDTLGRMLHNFSCTAYEIADCNFNNLQKYNFINAYETDYQELKFKMLNLKETYYEKNRQSETLNIQVTTEGGAYYMAIIDQYSYCAFRIVYANGTSSIIDCGNSTGQYVFNTENLKENPITSITLLEGDPDINSKILYGYYEVSDIAFSLISNLTRDTVIDQIIGHPKTNYRDDSFNINYINAIENGIGYWDRNYQIQRLYGTAKVPRKKIGKFYYLKAEPRTSVEVYYKNNKYYHTDQCNHEVLVWDDTSIYQVYVQSSGEWKLYEQYSGRPSNNIILTKPNYYLKLNVKGSEEEFIDLSLRGSSSINAPVTTGRYEIYFDLDKLENLYIGSGVKCEICYNLTTITYEAEVNSLYSELNKAKVSWEETYSTYATLLRDGTSRYSDAAEAARLEEEFNYHNYLNVLFNTLEDIQREGDTYYAL